MGLNHSTVAFLGRVAIGPQRPIVIKLPVDDLSVCPVNCGKTADRIRMPFGIVGRTGPRMRQVVGFRDRSTVMGTFGGEFGARHGPRGPTARTCATALRRGPLAKLLCADLLMLILSVF